MILSIYATSDLHGFVTPFRYSDQKEDQIGLSKLSLYLKNRDRSSSILIDNGDTLQGSPLCYYHHLYHEEKIHPLVDCLNHIGYDYYNIGNHDFDYHQDVTYQFIKDFKGKCITGNIIDQKNRFHFSYDIKEIQGYKVALVGATNHFISQWEKAENIEELQFIHSYDYLKETIAYIQQNERYDYLVVAYHGGFERNIEDGSMPLRESNDNVGYRLCKECKGIDILISGHQHRSIEYKIHQTQVVQVAQNGQELAHITIDTESKVIEAQLVKASSTIDYDLLKIIEQEEKETQIWLDKSIGSFDDGDCMIQDPFQSRLHKHPCVSFLNQIQMEYCRADVSACALFNETVGFQHDIKMRDIVSTYVYPNTLLKLKITGKTLKEYLEKAAEYFAIIDEELAVDESFQIPKPIHFEYDMIDGVEYTIQVSNSIGKRVISCLYKGKEIQDHDSFTFVVNNYRYAGGGNYTMLIDAEVLMNDGKEMVEIIAEYIMKHSPVHINHNENILVIK